MSEYLVISPDGTARFAESAPSKVLNGEKAVAIGPSRALQQERRIDELEARLAAVEAQLAAKIR